ncbi:MAG: hypothetical protein IJB75_03245 [Oscillospiraceae bacterium]|nr:hypothetical protein [Oscillospiraceae bacterium]
MGRNSFDVKKFMKELEKDIKKGVEKDLKRHPEKVLDHHVGEELQGKCPSCGCGTVIVVRGGSARCPKCGHTGNVSLEPEWR